MEYVALDDGTSGWRCRECGRVYSSKDKSSLRSHIEAQHRDLVNIVYTCDVCRMQVDTKKKLYNHKRRECRNMKPSTGGKFT